MRKKTTEVWLHGIHPIYRHGSPISSLFTLPVPLAPVRISEEIHNRQPANHSKDAVPATKQCPADLLRAAWTISDDKPRPSDCSATSRCSPRATALDRVDR